MNFWYLTLALLFAFANASAETTGSSDRGETLFLQFACYSCHGYNGTGNPPLSKAASGILASEAAFISYLRLRADQNPVNPSRSMPNYSRATLSDENARDIYAYLAGLEHIDPALEDIPAFVEILESAEQETNDTDNQ